LSLGHACLLACFHASCQEKKKGTQKFFCK
jgi:hypothetical protein